MNIHIDPAPPHPHATGPSERYPRKFPLLVTPAVFHTRDPAPVSVSYARTPRSTPTLYAARARFIPAPRWDWDSPFAGVEGATASGFFSAASATGSGLAGAASFLSLFFVRLRGMVND